MPFFAFILFLVALFVCLFYALIFIDHENDLSLLHVYGTFLCPSLPCVFTQHFGYSLFCKCL